MDQGTSQGVFLGVDGGGTKTEFVLIDAAGQVRARHQTATTYYLQIGMDGLARVLGDGVAAILAKAKLSADDILTFLFLRSTTSTLLIYPFHTKMKQLKMFCVQI